MTTTHPPLISPSIGRAFLRAAYIFMSPLLAMKTSLRRCTCMKRNHMISAISNPILIARAWHSQRFAISFKWYLRPSWLFYLACVASTLFLSETHLPAAVVTNENDSGPGSLRQAVSTASSNDPIILFAPGVTHITLTSGRIEIGMNVALIKGPGKDALTISSSSSPVFSASISTSRVTISDLSIAFSSGAVISNAEMEIKRCAFFRNTDDAIINSGFMSIADSTIANNLGHGIVNYSSSGDLRVKNSTISGNSASGTPNVYGGGIQNSALMTIENCTISGNSAGDLTTTGNGFGGGIYNTGSLSIQSSTIAHNVSNGGFVSSGFGGGIYSTGTTTLDSNIVALNSAPNGTDVRGPGINSDGHNVIGDGFLLAWAPTDQVGTPGAPIDPLLGPLMDNGGPTLTHALQPGSPAIDRGDPNVDSVDQRGYARPGIPDVGAFEFHGVPPPAPPRLGNISTRAFVQTGDNVVIGGFIVQGNRPNPAPKRVIIRAIGPELTQFGVPNALADPRLELHNHTGALIASNDNWQTTVIGGIITGNQVSDIQNSGYAPGDGRESAIIADLPPGNYTAIVRGVNNTTGVALVEVYDLSRDPNSILSNISTRSFVQTGDNVMIGGFILQGTEPKAVVVRAIGPELTQYGVRNALADPTLELHDGSGAVIGDNDNWQAGLNVNFLKSVGLAPGDARESAIFTVLAPGKYTAIVRGKNNTTGVALVEVYDLNLY